jgi:hypothetical protein
MSLRAARIVAVYAHIEIIMWLNLTNKHMQS